ncbi:MAG: HD domain-containing protein [Candidatus Methanoperedens sp.]
MDVIILTISKEAKELLESYAKEKISPDSESKQESLILNEFSKIFPDIEKTTRPDRIKLMNLWLDGHVDKYFKKLEEYKQTDWQSSEVYIPVHGLVHLRPEIKYLLSIPLIRRCNAIKQLSTAYMIYPGAKHTRDEHQLGTLFVMQRFCEHLIKEKAIHAKDQATLEVAALIHDVAHPPLGHSLDSIKEFLIPRSPLSSHYSYEKKIDKTLLEIYLTDEKYQLKGAIESIKVIDTDLLKSMLLDNFENSDKFPPAYSDMIDSEIDADRIDYLLRDGIHTGKKIDFDINLIIQSSHFCELKEGDKKRTSLCFDEKRKRDLTSLLTFRKNMYEEVYENDDKVILDEVIVHIIYCTISLYYGLKNDNVTKKFLLLNDCEINDFLGLFSPISIFKQYTSQLYGKPEYTLIKKYYLNDNNSSDFSRALKEASSKYSRVFGFDLKFREERQFSENLKIMRGEDETHEIPSILFSLPHYIPSQNSDNYEREGKRKRGLKDLVLRDSDGHCDYFKNLAGITKEKDLSSNKFLLIGKEEGIEKDYIIEEFEKFMMERHGT